MATSFNLIPCSGQKTKTSQQQQQKQPTITTKKTTGKLKQRLYFLKVICLLIVLHKYITSSGKAAVTFHTWWGTVISVTKKWQMKILSAAGLQPWVSFLTVIWQVGDVKLMTSVIWHPSYWKWDIFIKSKCSSAKGKAPLHLVLSQTLVSTTAWDICTGACCCLWTFLKIEEESMCWINSPGSIRKEQLDLPL